MGQVQGKVALVTGGARGQGAEHARLLASEGADVLITDILDETGKALVAELRSDGLHAEYLHLDVSSREQWEHAIASVEQAFGKLDILVNNAGVVGYSRAAECPPEEWHRVIAINQTGVFLSFGAAIPALRRTGGGSIINVASVIGLNGADGYIAYGASKAAIIYMTKSAATSYAAENIRVNAIAPGSLDTVMLREEAAHHGVDVSVMARSAPIARAAHANETSPAVLYLASDASSFVTGAVLPIDGGLTARIV